MIKLGATYKKHFLEEHISPNIIRYDIVKKDYGYFITKVTTYVSIIKIKLIINKNKSAKAIVKVNTNYRSPYQYTLYFDCAMKEIKGNTTREEMLYYKTIQ